MGSVRFVNVDWVVACILRHLHPNLFKVFSYDIVCVWAKHLIERLKALPGIWRLELVAALCRFVIPKMHIQAHKFVCRLLFSLAWLLGAAQVDGEGIERPWASLGALAASTMRMGPGFRHDTMDCQLSYWNWQKLVHICACFRFRQILC